MNNCMLLAEIVQAPQLRYTSDNQTPVAEFVVQFPGLKEGDGAAQMKVVGWGNLAQEIQAHYQAGQRVLLEGRLAMNVVDRPEGFKEKQVEMTVQRIYDAGSLGSMTMSPPPSMPQPSATARPSSPAAPAPVTLAEPEANPNYDDIPF
ncbi:MAG TPA: single-stranded DNA-binding protein [Leptolyngbyaceae cyanobacterium M65_K2018_010]|nr:single-stranded DNA-binding protein [Leptolyngbyaceae cyanobacterium M65_K2018_010]